MLELSLELVPKCYGINVVGKGINLMEFDMEAKSYLRNCLGGFGRQSSTRWLEKLGIISMGLEECVESFNIVWRMREVLLCH